MTTAHRKQLEANNKAKRKARATIIAELDPTTLKPNAAANHKKQTKTQTKKTAA